MTDMARYAGIYAVDRKRLVSPRTTAAAARLAHYDARRAARRDGRIPGAVMSHQVAESARVDGIALFDDDLIAIRVEIETRNGAT